MGDEMAWIEDMADGTTSRPRVDDTLMTDRVTLMATATAWFLTISMGTSGRRIEAEVHGGSGVERGIGIGIKMVGLKMVGETNTGEKGLSTGMRSEMVTEIGAQTQAEKGIETRTGGVGIETLIATVPDDMPANPSPVSQIARKRRDLLLQSLGWSRDSDAVQA